MKKITIGIIISLIIVGALIGLGAKIATSYIIGDQVDQAISSLPNNLDIAYDSVDVSLLSQDMRFEDVTYASKGLEEPVYIKEIIIHDIDDVWRDRLSAEGVNTFSKNSHNIPTSLNIELSGIEITSKMFVSQMNDAPDLTTLGYTYPLYANMKVNYDYDQVSKEIHVEKMILSVDDMLTADIDLHLGGLSLNEIIRLGQIDLDSPMQAIGLLTAMKLHAFNFIFTDDSIIDRLLAARAKESNQTIQSVRQQMIASVDEAIRNETDENIKVMAAELRDFIDDPDVMKIGINPDSPITFTDLLPLMLSQETSANDIIEIFKLTIDTK